MSKRTPAFLLGSLGALVLAIGSIETGAVEQPTFLFQWGRLATYQPGVFGFPRGIAVDQGNGDVFVSDQNTGRIQRFASDGTFLADWVCWGCEGVDVNELTHNIYVGRVSTNTVAEFSNTGNLIREWGGFGTIDGKFNLPRNVTVDASTGTVYVMDVLNARIQAFDSGGNFLRKWGSKGTGDGQFSGVKGPHAIAFDPINKLIYATDPRQNTVQKFDEFGNFLGKWEFAWGTAPGETRWIRDIAVGPDGNLYVADSDNERIQVFSPDGASLEVFNGPHNSADGPFHPRAVAINRGTGEKYVAAAYAHRIDKFSLPNAYLFSWGGREVDGDVLFSPKGIAVSPLNGDVYILDTRNFKVKQFTHRGEFGLQWGASSRLGAPGGGWGDGLIGFGDNAITVAPDGSVWTASSYTTYGDPLAKFIQKFTPDGTFQGSWPTTSPLSWENRGIASDAFRKRLYISEASVGVVQTYDFNGGILGALASIVQPAGIAVNKDSIYVVDGSCNCIMKFGIDGSFLRQWGGSGTLPGAFNFSLYSGLATDLRGNVYAADTRNHRIQVFSSDGLLLYTLGTEGKEAGQFRGPEAVAISHPYDTLYVLDNHRVQAFSLNTQPTGSVLGRPVYVPGVSVGAFLWKDYFDGPYHLRLSADSGGAQYDVRLVSGADLVSVQPITIGPDDVWESKSAGFRLQSTTLASEAGVDFVLPPGTKALMAIEQDGVADPRQLSVGSSSETPPSAGWVVPAARFPARPGFIWGQQLGFFIGRGASPDKLDARWGGDGAPHTMNILLLADEPFTSVIGRQLEGNDRLTQSSSGVEIEAFVSNWWDGVELSILSGTNIGVSYQQDSFSGVHYVNPGPGHLGTPNAYSVPVMEPYGQPSFDASVEGKVFVWKNPNQGTWHLRVTAGGENTRYIGSISSDRPATMVVGVELENNDVVDAGEPTTIQFDLRVIGRGQDGIDMAFPGDSTITLNMTAPDPSPEERLAVGSLKWPVSQLPLDLSGW